MADTNDASNLKESVKLARSVIQEGFYVKCFLILEILGTFGQFAAPLVEHGV